MKPERKPFVVEVKKHRSLTRKANAIWGTIDLKSAADEIRGDELADGNDVTTLGSAIADRKADNEA